MASKKHHHGSKGLTRLLAPNANLKGKDLRKAARALTKLTIKPQTGAYKRLAHELQGEKAAEQLGLQHLGERTTGTVSGIYQNLAKTQAENVARQSALGNLLNRNTANITQRDAGAFAGQQGAALSTQLQSQALRGAPGGGQAQQQLASMVASQQGQAANEARAQQAFAASQGSGFAGLASAQASATQQQGQTAAAGIQASIANRIAESNLKYGQDIREAQGKKAEAQALKGSTMVQNLLNLRKQEQDYGLGKKSIQQRQSAAKLSARTSRANSKRTARTARKSRAETHRHNIQTEQHARHTEHQGGDGHGGENAHQHHRAVQDIAAQTKSYIKKYGVPKGKPLHKVLGGYENLSYTGGYNQKLVNKVIERIISRKYKGGKKHGGGGGSGNPA